MALDRQSIEKRDFQISRRGYEPEQVDAHLSALASEVEQLRSGGAEGQPRATSMAVAASDQVRTIIEAAEKSAAEIEQSAREDAAGIRADAKRDAEVTREEALKRSADHVAKVQEAAGAMLKRIDAMRQEMDTLVAGLSTGAASLSSDLATLHGDVEGLYDGSGVQPGGGPSPQPLSEEPHVGAPEPPPAPHAAEAPEAAEEAEPESEPEPAEQAAPAPAGGDRDTDVEGARLIALNMALNGSERDETDAYLSENFDIPDRAALLDEVYATVEG